jgi:hypothetical protein
MPTTTLNGVGSRGRSSRPRHSPPSWQCCDTLGYVALTWEELELPVLQWVLDHGDEGTGQLYFTSADAFGGVPSLTGPQVAEALRRLQEHGLVVSNGPLSTNAFDEWRRARPSADGLRVLGQWPPTQAAAVNVALARILRSLADSDAIPDEDKPAARRAAGTVASTAGEVVMDVVQDEMTRLITRA